MHEILTIGIMAIALGMDAFSVTFGMGMLGLRAHQIFKIGLTIGAFHLAMPLLGMAVGKWLSGHFDVIATYIGGGLLLVIGIQMMLNSFSPSDEKSLKPVGIGLFFFAIGVSLDSFSAGLSFGILGAKAALTIVMIGAVSMIMSWLGLVIGSRFQSYLGSYGELLGGSVLIGFGLKIMLPL
ncbi:manganese efflux pump MntP [Shouchella shacheensis]|uniref:manganese efflux pump MntP n=1 Tax=Shouchella shacheensis TaxID=1649580 RepID=UPI000740008E|nr:manganese efflux pump MntP family protein [Shouchella shacheensis]